MDKSIRINERDSFVAYSLPGRIDHYLITGKVSSNPPDSPFFVFQNFEKSESSAHYLVAKEVVLNGSFTCQVSAFNYRESTSVSSYLNMIDKTIARIRSGTNEKIVMSKVKVLPRSEDDVYDLFMRLKVKYPNAFVFLYHTPEIGWWCGASPEVLLKVENNRMTTMALAGTQRDNGLPLDQVIWGDKERHEQGVIEDYVIEVLQRNKVTYTKEGPITVRAAQVLHLQSTFYFETKKSGLSLAEMLHPGPAICGLPEREAFDWIIDHEEHDREQYCGYIGPWGIDEVYALFVNLRSMRIYNNCYQLFLGGGITAGSDSKSEWDETEQKARTLASVLNKSLVA